MPDDVLTLNRPDQFRAIGDATRMRILGRLVQAPATVQELSADLRVPKGTISHHVGVLEAAGLIRVVEERRVRAVIERRYARVSRMFRIDEPKDIDGDLRESLRMLPLRQAIDEARPPHGRDDPSTSLLVRARMPAARARRFARLVEQLAEEFGAGAPEAGETYGFAAAIYAADWSRRETGTADAARAGEAPAHGRDGRNDEG